MMQNGDSPSTDHEAAALVETARGLYPVIRAEAERAEANRKLPEHIMEALRGAGFFRVLQPQQFGGLELGPDTAAEIVIELSAACGSTGWVAGCAISHQWMVGQFPIACQEEVWGDGADKLIVSSFAPGGDCTAVDGGFRLTGTWRYASGCDHGDIAMIGVRFPPRAGESDPTPGFVLVPMADCRRVEDWDPMGLAATGSHALILDGVMVPDHRCIALRDLASGNGPGRSAFATGLGRYPVFSIGPYCIAATALGCLQGGLGDFLSELRGWKTRGGAVGGGTAVSDFPTIQARLGRAEAALAAAKALLFYRVETSRRTVFERGEALSTDERIENRVAQVQAVRLANQGLAEIWDAAGGTGIHRDRPLQRAWRDAQAVAHHFFFNWDATCILNGQRLLGLDPHGQF